MVVYNVEIVEGGDQPRGMGKTKFDEKGVIDGLMVRAKKTLWGTGKVAVMDIGIFVLEEFISMVEKGFFGSALIKKSRYWHKGVPSEDFRHIQNNEVGDVGVVQGPIIRKSYHIMDIKYPNYVMLMMTTSQRVSRNVGQGPPLPPTS